MQPLVISFLSLLFVGGVLANRDLEDYRSAPKRFHRKIRETSAEGANASFVLDIPFPQHFLYSLNRLNLSLPFLTNVSVPEDPPTPEFKIEDVINRPEFRNPPTTQTPDIEQSGVSSKQGPRLTKRNVGTNRTRLTTYQPVIIRRKANSTNSTSERSSAYKERLTKHRLAQLRDATAKFKAINSDDSGRNANRDNVQGDNSQQVEHRTPFPVSGFRSELPTRSGEFASESPLRATLDRPSQRDPFYSSRSEARPPWLQSSSGQPKRPPINTPLSRQHQLEFDLPNINFPPPKPTSKKISAPTAPLNASAPYLSQLPHQALDDKIPDKLSSEAPTQRFRPTPIPVPDVTTKDPTQIQKPEEDSTERTPLVFGLPPGDFAPNSAQFPLVNLTFPSFDFPSFGNSSAVTLPPPLPLEELLKKFSGSNPAASVEPPQIGNFSLPVFPSVGNFTGFEFNQLNFSAFPSIQPSGSTPPPTTFEPIDFDKFDAELKKLLEAAPSANISVQIPSPSTGQVELLTTESPPVQDFPRVQIPTPSSTTEALDHQPLNFSVAKTTIISSSDSAPVSLENADLATPENVTSVGRGPLDVSSFDSSFPSFQSGGFSQQQFGGAQSFNLQPQSFNLQANDAGSNPYLYANLPFSHPAGGQSGSNFGGFEGDLSNPNGPPVGGFNSITQGLSLLASFGGPSGGIFTPNFFSSGGYDPSLIPGGFRGGSFDFNSLQASTPVQTSLPYPQNQFPQTSGFQQSYHPQQQVQFNPAAFSQNAFQQQPQFQQPQFQQTQFQQTQFQQPQFQQPAQNQYPQFQSYPQATNPVGSQQYQFNPSANSISPNSATFNGINPAQFGTLLSNAPTAATAPAAAPAKAVDTTSGSASSPKASASQIVEVTLDPSIPVAEARDSSVSASAAQLIAIGPPSDYSDQRAFYKYGKKSLVSKGLRSGYY